MRLSLAVFMCLPMLACADSHNLDVKYYEIAGSTARELRADLNRIGPVSEETGIRNDAYTHWYIEWRYDFDRDADSCTASNFRVNLTATMTMPHWNPPGNAAPELRELWSKYVAALRHHEDGHYNLAIGAADEVRRQLGARNHGPNCDVLATDLNAAANAVLGDFRQREAAYDHDTDSGRRQGANLL